ncbi:MAG: UPF0489 family protein [Nostoc sp. DedVER02]|nr:MULTISPECIES: UPF0489 family protein [unclassified Nostoc]MDZ8114837.1 UPF0489 family protein [Nostoc sp. DedVER01b]
MTAIPVLIVEEHHEAFWIWHYAISQNIIPKSKNILLHIDEHSDMATPRFTRSLNSINNNLQDIYDFTYHELNIASFIVPAVYQRVFNQVFWLRPRLKESSSEFMCVYACDPEETIFLTKNVKNIGAILLDPKYKTAKYTCLTVKDEFPENQTVVLDIDLDYFSCNNRYYNDTGRIEITEFQYQSFQRDNYQFLRITYGSSIRAEIEDGKYYLVFNEFPQTELFPNILKLSEDKILERIDQLIEFLVQKQVQVSMIDICRSRISGYTPADQCQFIEDNLLKKLGELYELNFVSLEQIKPQPLDTGAALSQI